MGQVKFDTDELAIRIRQYLNMANYGFAAANAGAHADYRDAVMALAAARELATTTYNKVRIENNDANDLERFARLNMEAASLITKVWEVLGIVVLKRVETGEIKAVHIEEAAPAPKPIRHTPARKRAEPHPMTSDEITNLITYFMEAERKNEKLANKEFVQLAGWSGHSAAAIRERYTRFTQGKYDKIKKSIERKRK